MLEAAGRGQAEPGRGAFDAGEQLRAGERVPGEVHGGESRQVLRLCGGDEGLGEVGQVGPGMRHVPRARVGQLTLGHRPGDDQVEPAAGTAAEEIARAQHGGAQSAGRTASRHLGFDGHADAALARVGTLRRVFAQQRRHLLAEVVDVARQHEARSQALRQVHAGGGHRHRLLRPAGVDRVQRVDHDLRARGLRGQGLGLAQRGLHQPHAARHAGRGVAPHLRQHSPASGVESLRGGQAEAAVGAEDEDGGALRGVHGGSPVSGVNGCKSGRL